MKTQVFRKLKTTKGLLAIPLSEGHISKLSASIPPKVKELINNLSKSKEFSGKIGETITTYLTDKSLPPKLLLIGTGQKISAKTARDTGGRIGKQARKSKSEEITILIPPELTPHIQELTEGLISAQYDISQLKSKPSKTYTAKQLNLVSEAKNLEQSIQKAIIIQEAAELVKDLVNSPSNLVNANILCEEAKRIAKENRYKIQIFRKRELTKMKWGGLLAVNQGSRIEPAAIIMQYDGAKNRREAPIILIGKGVIFDTGGYNLKGVNSIETMHQDMAGAATVLGTMSALKKLKIRKNVIAIIPTTENLINEDAYRPSDIITMLSGLTVEVTNTDAEGRMILADALHYSTRFKPQAILSIATLTGAAEVALGIRYAALLTNEQPLLNRVKEAGEQVDDLCWQLPIHPHYREMMKSKIADLRNYDRGTGRSAGTAKAAAFLENFVGDCHWCHVDIGGTAFTTDPKAYQTEGATAHGLQTFLKFLENEAS